MLHFTVHVGPGDADGEGTQLVPEGFSWMAFFVPVLWLPLKGLWVPLVILLSLYVFLGLAELQGLISPQVNVAISLAISLLAGLEGRNWQRHRLARLGYVEAGTVAGANLLDAETRWFAQNPPVKLSAPLASPKPPASIPSLLPWPGQTA